MRSSASVGLNGRLAYQIDKTLRVELEGYNLANRRDSAIDYHYASRLLRARRSRSTISTSIRWNHARCA